MTNITWDEKREWVSDSNGNRCSVEYFGSEDEAVEALESLIGCKNCINCTDCTDCTDCTLCSNCIRCTRCADRENGRNEVGEAVIVPVISDIDLKVFQAASGDNALDMSSWHSCGTTHCRAGWAAHLAGEAGYALERQFGTALAAIMIYRESGSPIRPVRFHDSNEVALEDMRKRAEASQ